MAPFLHGLGRMVYWALVDPFHRLVFPGLILGSPGVREADRVGYSADPVIDVSPLHSRDAI
jgi:hypothetical protein